MIAPTHMSSASGASSAETLGQHRQRVGHAERPSVDRGTQPGHAAWTAKLEMRARVPDRHHCERVAKWARYGPYIDSYVALWGLRDALRPCAALLQTAQEGHRP